MAASWIDASKFRVVAHKTTITCPENIRIGSNFCSTGELYLYGNDGRN